MFFCHHRSIGPALVPLLPRHSYSMSSQHQRSSVVDSSTLHRLSLGAATLASVSSHTHPCAHQLCFLAQIVRIALNLVAGNTAAPHLFLIGPFHWTAPRGLDVDRDTARGPYMTVVVTLGSSLARSIACRTHPSFHF
jgi:hypothetical protein